MLLLHGLRDNVESREYFGIQKNITVHVTVVGGGVASGDGEQEGVDEGKMVGVGLVGGDDIDTQGCGVTDERRGFGEQDTFEGVLLLEKVEQCEGVSENDRNGLGMTRREKRYLVFCRDAHHELVMGGGCSLFCRRDC